MANAPQLSIVIPCYNEAESLPSLHKQFFPAVAALAAEKGETEVIFVDDGSGDETWAALTALRASTSIPNVTIRLERHEVNRGVGAALRTGFAAARGEIIVTTDSDATYRFEEIPNLLAKLTANVDIVTASPYHPEGGVKNVPVYRLVLSRGSSLLYRVLVDWKIHCYTSLFRAYRSDVIKNVPFESDGFLAGTELMVNAMLRGYRVAEYPTTLHSRIHGVSKAKLMRTIRAHLRYQRHVLGQRLGLRDTAATQAQQLQRGEG